MSRMRRQDGHTAYETQTLEEAERWLEVAHRILDTGSGHDSDTWLHLASIAGEADLAVQEERRRNPTFELPLLETVVAELRQATANFTDLEFLRSTGPARRRNPKLFK